MKLEWKILIWGAVAWLVVLATELFAIDPLQRIDVSLRYLATTLVAVGLAAAIVREALVDSGRGFAAALSPVPQEVREGFGRMIAALQEFDLSTELRDLRRHLPHQVKYMSYTRHIMLEATGDGILEHEYIVKNISTEPLNSVVLPLWGFDVGTNSPPYEELLGLEVDGRRLHKSIDSLRTFTVRSGLMLDPDDTSSRMVECCYTIPIKINPGEVRKINLHMRNRFFAESMYDSDWVGARVYDITERLVVRLKPPTGHRIELIALPSHPKAVKVFHTATTLEHRAEVERVPEPEVGTDGEVYWNVTAPQIGHSYCYRYRVIPSP